MTPCTHCINIGKIKVGVFRTLYCICSVGVERQEFDAWINKHADEVDPDLAWIIYMHGKIAGVEAMIEQFKKGSHE